MQSPSPAAQVGSRAQGHRHRAPLPALCPAHLVGPVPTGVAVGGHDNHFLEVGDFWSRESRQTSKQQPRGGRTPLRGVVSSPESALHSSRPQVRAASGLWSSKESPGTQCPQPCARIRTNFMLVLAGALHSGQLVLNCSTWGGKGQPEGPSQPRAPGLSVPECPWHCSSPHLVPQVLGSVRRLRVHLLSLQGQQSQLLLPAGAPREQGKEQGLLQSPAGPAGHTAGGSSCSE